MIPWLVSSALAQAPTDEVVRAAVDALYGKPIPAEAVCVTRPELPARFREPAVVGVRRGARGCVLIGVVLDAAIVPPASAAGAARDPEAWAAVDPAQRAQDLLAWTERVLLAFDQPDASVAGQVGAAKGGGHTVERAYLRRDEVSGRSLRATGRFTFDDGLALAPVEETVDRRYETTMFVRPDRVTGLDAGVVEQALTAQGGSIRKCFTEAWEADLALAGRVRLEWVVSGGKADALAVLADDDPPEALARCYARAVRAVPFPADAAGEVRWVFAVDRRELTD